MPVLRLSNLVSRYRRYASEEYVKHGRPTSQQSAIKAATDYLLEVEISGEALLGREPTGTATPPEVLPQLNLLAQDLPGAGGEPVRRLAELHVEELRREDLADYQRHLLAKRNRRGQPWTVAHINTCRQLVLKMVEWAEDERLLSADVVNELRRCKPLRRGKTTARRSTRVSPADGGELHRLVEAIRGDAAKLPAKSAANRRRRRERMLLAVALELGWETGMRPIEIVILRPCDVRRVGYVDDEGRDVEVYEYEPAEFKTEHADASPRVVTFTDRAAELFDEAVALRSYDGGQSTLSFATEYDPDERLFTWRAKNPIHARSAMYQATVRSLKRHGLPPMTPRQLRHAFLTDAASIDVRGAQHAGGHRHFSTTENYLHGEARARRELIQRMNRRSHPNQPPPEDGGPFRLRLAQ
ncbi:MAG: tyrosine-type recombinase/integrase [Planctomycetota bacterium]